MFKAKLKDSKIVKGIFEAVSAIISEGYLETNQNGLTLGAMDGSHIALVFLNLMKEDFDEYECDQPYKLGINLEDLVKILKRSGNNDQITLQYDQTERQIIVEMKPEKSKKSRTFTLSLMDVDEESINWDSLNKIPYCNSCSMSLDLLDEAIKDAEIYSEVLNIKIKDKMFMSTEGSIGKANTVLEKEELIAAEFTKESEGSYALTYLKSIMKISGIISNVDMAFLTENPLKMHFKLLDHSDIFYFVAPRVPDEEQRITVKEETEKEKPKKKSSRKKEEKEEKEETESGKKIEAEETEETEEKK